MDTRLAILSAAAFAGVVVGGALVADPSLGSSLRPASIWSQAAAALGGEEWEDHDDDDEWEDREARDHDDDGREEHEARDVTKHTPLSIPFGERRAPDHDDHDGDDDDHDEDDD